MPYPGIRHGGSTHRSAGFLLPARRIAMNTLLDDRTGVVGTRPATAPKRITRRVLSKGAALGAVVGTAAVLVRKETAMPTITVSPSMIHSQVAPGFEAVEAAFRQNFAQRGDIG